MTTLNTTGPWQVVTGPGNIYLIVGYRGKTILTTSDKNVADLIVDAPDLLALVRRMYPWLGKMIADGGHKETVAPLDAENALKQADAMLTKHNAHK